MSNLAVLSRRCLKAWEGVFRIGDYMNVIDAVHSRERPLPRPRGPRLNDGWWEAYMVLPADILSLAWRPSVLAWPTGRAGHWGIVLYILNGAYQCSIAAVDGAGADGGGRSSATYGRGPHRRGCDQLGCWGWGSWCHPQIEIGFSVVFFVSLKQWAYTWPRQSAWEKQSASAADRDTPKHEESREARGMTRKYTEQIWQARRWTSPALSPVGVRAGGRRQHPSRLATHSPAA